jgi:hypothetical protein
MEGPEHVANPSGSGVAAQQACWTQTIGIGGIWNWQNPRATYAAARTVNSARRALQARHDYIDDRTCEAVVEWQM